MVNESSSARITPWVGRLLAANAVVLLLQETIFTSGYLSQLLSFDPALVIRRPWTLLTYMFIHAGVFHLAGNALALFVFGPAVERRLGSRGFLVYYLYCGIGAAVFTVMLRSLGVAVDPFVGASGAILGVMLAFARMLPETPLMLLLVPVPIKAKWMVPMLAAFDLAGLVFQFNDGIAHSAHIGGLLAGILYFVLRGIARPPDPMPLASMRPRVPVAARGGGGGVLQREITPRSEPSSQAAHAPHHAGDDEAVEIDRVLDKISATGIASLTADERRFLDTVARRRRDLPH